MANSEARMAILTTNGTFVVPENVTKIFVYMVGGGAGGSSLRGCGGSSGEYKEFVMDVTPGQQISYTIGLGGEGSILFRDSAFPMVSVGNSSGQHGTATSFGGVVAVGGNPGDSALDTAGSNYYYGGAAPSQLSQGGQSMLQSLYLGPDGPNFFPGGIGGGNPFGPGGMGGQYKAKAVPAGTLTPGQNGIAPGTGGGGGYTLQTAPTTARFSKGGNGRNGQIVVRW